MNNIEQAVKQVTEGKLTKDELYIILEDFIVNQQVLYKKYITPTLLEKGEVLSLIWLGIERAMATYASKKNCSFTTWASNCIKYHILKEINRRLKRETSLDSEICQTDVSILETIQDLDASSAFEKTEESIDGKKIIDALKILSKTDQKIVILSAIKNVPIAAIAKMLNLSDGNVRNRRFAALKKLRAILKKS